VDAASHPQFSVLSSKLLSTLSPHRLTTITNEKMHQCPPHSIKDSNPTPTPTQGTSPACQCPARSFPPLDQRCSAHSHLLQYFALTIIWACTGTCALPAPSHLHHTIAPACLGGVLTIPSSLCTPAILHTYQDCPPPHYLSTTMTIPICKCSQPPHVGLPRRFWRAISQV